MGKKAEKFMRSWEKERKGGRERYMLRRTVLLGLGVMVGSMMGKVMRGEPFFLDYFVFLSGAIGGAIGSSIAWMRSEKRYQNLLEEKEPLEGPDGPREPD